MCIEESITLLISSSCGLLLLVFALWWFLWDAWKVCWLILFVLNSLLGERFVERLEGEGEGIVERLEGEGL